MLCKMPANSAIVVSQIVNEISFSFVSFGCGVKLRTEFYILGDRERCDDGDQSFGLLAHDGSYTEDIRVVVPGKDSKSFLSSGYRLFVYVELFLTPVGLHLLFSSDRDCTRPAPAPWIHWHPDRIPPALGVSSAAKGPELPREQGTTVSATPSESCASGGPSQTPSVPGNEVPRLAPDAWRPHANRHVERPPIASEPASDQSRNAEEEEGRTMEEQESISCSQSGLGPTSLERRTPKSAEVLEALIKRHQGAR